MSAFEQNLTSITHPSAGSLVSKQYFMGKIGSSGVALCSSQGEVCDGIIQNDDTTDAAGRAIQLAVGGVSKVVLGETLAIGALITPGTAGKAEVAASGDYIFGRLLTGGVANDVASVLILHAGRVA